MLRLLELTYDNLVAIVVDRYEKRSIPGQISIS